MDSNCQEDQEEKKTFRNRSVLVKIVVILWVLAGLASYFVSLACIPGSTFKHNIIGLVVSCFFGPLYFIYLWVMRDHGYCYGNDSRVSAGRISASRRS